MTVTLPAALHATPELADEYGRITARYTDHDGHIRGENRYLSRRGRARARARRGARVHRRASAHHRVRETAVSDLTTILLDTLDDRALATLADRLRPYLDTNPDRLLTPHEAADRLGLHVKTVTRAAAAGRIPTAVRVGRAWRFRPEGLALVPPAGTPPTHAPPRPRPHRSQHSTVTAIRTAGPPVRKPA